jgi:predicted TPR repeat methyltransferase
VTLPPAFRSSGDLLADRRYDYAMAAKAEGDLVAAADLLTQALEIAPRWVAGWFALGEVEAARGAAAAAEAALSKALALDPDDALGARLILARLGRADAGAAMTEAYIRTLYDDYAPRFEKALREGLAYRAPEILRDAVAAACAAAGRAPSYSRMLDLGCGTGLAGPVFAPLAAAIDGVDLSPRMVELARQKGVYRRLAVGDLVSFVAHEAAASADLVLAADVLIYVAELAPVFAGAARVLAPGGLLAFTVEAHDSDGLLLHASLRYAHGRDLIEAGLAVAGLALVSLARVVLRTEAGAPVTGWAVIAAKGR